MEKSNESEFVDAEDTTYFSHKDQQFSHQALVMEAMRRCSEAGSHEMRTGYWNDKIDISGNVIKTYVEDTRAKFIECVKSVEMTMSCDLDGDAKNKISYLKYYLSQKKKSLLAEQWSWFNGLPPLHKNNILDTYGGIIRGAFNTNLFWWQRLMEEELKVYRKIFEELTKLTARLGFYESKVARE